MVASSSPRNIIELRQYHPWAVQRIPPNINYDTIFGSNEENDAAIANTSTLSSPPLHNGKGEEGKVTTTANDVNTEVASTIRKRVEISRMAKQAIEALNDQPGECLRDGIDEIDFELLQDYDLSNIPKPGSFSDDDGNDNSEWLLVDTPAKMKQCIQELEVRPRPIYIHSKRMIHHRRETSISSDFVQTIVMPCDFPFRICYSSSREPSQQNLRSMLRHITSRIMRN